MIELKIEEALQEINSKTYRDIQRETAVKWASRAAASYEMVSRVSAEHKLVYWTLGEEYNHEAIEHAALVEDETGLLVKQVQLAVKPYQEKAVQHIDAIFGVVGVDATDQELQDES